MKKYLGEREVMDKGVFTVKAAKLNNGYIMGRLILVENTTKSGIYIPESKDKASAQSNKYFRVIKIDETDKATTVKPGDIVCLNMYNETVKEDMTFAQFKQGNIIEYYTGL